MRRLLLAAVIAAAVALSGCSATVTGSPAPTGAVTGDGGAVAATTDPVAWMDKVCGSLLPFTVTVSTAPSLDSKDPSAVARSLIDYLGKSETAIDQALAGLDAAGPSPIAAGDPAVAKIKSALTTVRTSFDKAKTALDKIDPTNAAEVASTLPTVLASLQDISGIQDPTTDLQTNPELKAAAAKAPNCQTLQKTN